MSTSVNDVDKVQIVGSDKTTVWNPAAPAAPTGSATSTKQDTGNTSLASIDTKVGEVQASPTANTLLDRLKALLTGIILAAGENHIGEVGGNSLIIKSAVAVQAAAYASGNCIGTKRPLTGAMRKSGGTGILQSICILDKSGQKPTGNILIFDVDPSAATTTDKTTFVASTNDVNVIARIPVTSSDWATPNVKSYAEKNGLGIVVQASGSADLFSVFVADAAYTFTSTSDIQIVYGFLRD